MNNSTVSDDPYQAVMQRVDTGSSLHCIKVFQNVVPGNRFVLVLLFHVSSRFSNAQACLGKDCDAAD